MGPAGSIGLNFAIPIDQAKRIADGIVQSGAVQRAVLGVAFAGVPFVERDGAVVQAVTPGSAAAAAGIRPGEVITKVDDRLITSGDELIAAIRSYPPGEQVDVTLSAPGGSSPRTVQATLGTETLPASA